MFGGVATAAPSCRMTPYRSVGLSGADLAEGMRDAVSPVTLMFLSCKLTRQLFFWLTEYSGEPGAPVDEHACVPLTRSAFRPAITIHVMMAGVALGIYEECGISSKHMSAVTSCEHARVMPGAGHMFTLFYG